MRLIHKRSAYILSVMIISLMTTDVVAQDSGSLSGTIYNNQTKEIVAGAELQLSPVNAATVADPWGKFMFKNLKEGKYELRITHVGFVEVVRNVTLREGTKQNLRIFLDQNVRMLEGVEVTTAYPNDNELNAELPYIKSVIGLKEINQSTANDIGDFLRGQPNVAGIRKGGTNIDPVVRGFKFSQLNVQVNNGMTIEGGCPNRMDPAIAHVEVEDIQSIEVYKGPYALRYGPSFGGVINLKTKGPTPSDNFEIGADVILGYSSNPLGLKQHLAVHGGNRHVFFNIAGNYNTFNDYKAGNGSYIPSSGLKYNALGQLGFAINKNHTVLLTVNNAFGRNIDFIALPMDLRTDDTRLYSFDYSGSNFSDVFKSLTLKVYRSDVDHGMDNKNRPFSDTIVAVTIVKAIVDGLRSEAIFEFGRGKLFAGIDYKHIYKDGQRVKSAILQPTLPVFTEQIWNNAMINNLGFFAEYHYNTSFAEYIGT